MAGRILSTAHGTRRDAFGVAEWGLMLFLATTWGASFLFIAYGLDAFAPGLVTFLRVALGAATLSVFPRARRPVRGEDWPRIVVLAATWVAIPFTFFPIAQQWINSAVAGMLNGGMPILAAVVAALLLRELPGRNQLVGLAVGFVGIVAIGLPTMGEGDNAPVGVMLVLGAVAFYAVSVNIVTPLQQRYGSVPVMWRMLVVASAMTLPFGLTGLSDSSWAPTPALAVAALGVAGTGLAFVAMAELSGRVGGTRAATVTYLIPVVAIVLGIAFRADRVELLAVAGVGLVILGALLLARRER